MEIVGLGFRPTDEELVDHYLKHKLLRDDPRVHVIHVIDLCDVEPWDVPESAIRFDGPEWFFFSPVDFKYSNSKRLNRTTKCGFWKATGKDRDIRSRDTNNVIGTKKTLVFYEGRVRRGVKSNWVIHEYHDATFPECQHLLDFSCLFYLCELYQIMLTILQNFQRTFVLCRLMKKPGKTTEGGTDSLNCDEGESNGLMAPDYENQATEEGIPWAEKYFSPIQQSQTGIEQEEESFPSYPFYNAYFRNENNITQIPFETTTEDDEFLNSIIADEKIIILWIFVTMKHTKRKRRGCFEMISGEGRHPLVTRLHISLWRSIVLKFLVLLPIPDNMMGTKIQTSSCDSTSDEPLEINSIEISRSPSTLARLKNQYHPRPDNFILQRTVAGRPRIQRKVSNNAVSHVQLEDSTTKLKLDCFLLSLQRMENTISKVPLGFRFHPTDEELVNYYLNRKLLNVDDPHVQIIPVIDPCKVEPWEIPEKSLIKSDDPEWFFFSPVGYKYSNSKKMNRTTKRGFWKVTGKDRMIKSRGNNVVIGSKRSVVFHEGRVPGGVKTNWVIHEYQSASHESQRTFVLCRLMKKAEEKKVVGIELPILSVDISTRTDMEIPNSPWFDDYMPNPFADTEEGGKFSLWTFDDNFRISEEKIYYCSVNSTQPQSLRKVYKEGSDTDAEVVSNLARKELPRVKSEKDQKDASSRENIETRIHESSDVNIKDCFIYMETISSSQNLFPRSIYVPSTLDFVPIGVGFRPTEDELVNYYLRHKLLCDDPRVHVIPDIDLCDVEPSQIPELLAKSAIRFDGQEWFFFSPVGYKYSNSKRFNRTTHCGFWKTTGVDRSIRSRDTNTVIGTKKTLVFYEGRVPDGVKSNWVIHEYHPVTFDESQKPGKTTEGGSDALICDEGEPSGLIVSDYENQATAVGGTFTGMETTFQAEKCFPPIQQSSIGIDQDAASFLNYPLAGAYFRNENNVTQIPFETTNEDNKTTTEDDEFFNSLLAYDNLDIDEESMHAFVNSSTPSESLKRVYCESSDTDAEVVSKPDGEIIDISTVRYEYPNSHQYHASKRLKSSHDVVHGGTCLLSSIHEANQDKKDSIFHDEFCGVETYSCESTADKPFEINCIEISTMGSLASMPVGYRFHPNDEELVGHYLNHKLLGNDSIVHNVIAQIDVCQFEPWDLPAFSMIKSDDQEWLFFSPLGLKFRKDTRNRCNRKTKAGFWKPTGKDRSIKIRGTNNVIGTKKTLVFYEGRSSHGVKTNWVIHEYHAVTFPDDKRGFVLCRLINKAEKKTGRGTNTLIHDEREPSSHVAADFENQGREDRISNVYTLPKVNLESIFPTPPRAEEYDSPSLQQSTIVIEEEPSSQAFSFPNPYLGEENNIMHIPLETIEEEDHLDNIYIDKFLNEIFAGEGAFMGKETIPTFVVKTIPALKKAYYESRETDGEPLSALARKDTQCIGKKKVGWERLELSTSGLLNQAMRPTR
ncbi:NAC domain-containing protein 91, partial [Mucuna pruriens]